MRSRTGNRCRPVSSLRVPIASRRGRGRLVPPNPVRLWNYGYLPCPLSALYGEMDLHRRVILITLRCPPSGPAPISRRRAGNWIERGTSAHTLHALHPHSSTPSTVRVLRRDTMTCAADGRPGNNCKEKTSGS